MPRQDQQDLLTALMTEQARIIACLKRFAMDQDTGALADARRSLRALADAEESIIFPAAARVVLRLEARRLLEDSRAERARQLTALEQLARKRAPRLRKLGALEVCDLIQHHANQHGALLIPVLASQLPRPVYRAISSAFLARYQAELERDAEAATVRPARAS